MSLNSRPVRPASNADAAIINYAKRHRESIGRQIDSLLHRASTLPPNDPAHKGIECTVERLNMEYQAED